MRIKKSIAFLLSLMMMLSIFSPLSVAAETSAETPVITVQSLADTAGAEIDVNVVIENNPGILGATFQVDYGDGLTLVSATNGDAFSKLTMTPSASLTSPCKFVWDGQEITSENTKDGIILTLRFKISEEAQDGDNYEVNISYKPGNIFDANLDPIDVDINNGYVSVISYMPGDLDGNKDVNSRDIILLRRHVAGGYEQEINEAAADVDNSTEANSRDIILIRRYVAGGYGVELMPSSPKCEHSLTKTDSVEATCTSDGNIAYWHCNLCNKYFADENAVTLVKIDDTIIKAEGHTVVIDEAVEPTYDSTGLTEGKHCSVCSEIIIAQTVLPKLEKDEYVITYYIHNNDNYLESIAIENPNPATYAKEDGLVLQDLIVKGYKFVGWFTAQSGGSQVTEISSGSTGNKTLYARWEKVEYTISFASDMVPQESITYTVGESRPLNKPKLDRYTFVGWSDKDGRIWDSIPAGTTGNITLYANWSSNRNKAVAKSTLGDPIICEDSSAGLILFTYEIGEIQNVPLYTILKLNCVNGIISSISTTISEEISSTQAKTIAQTISNATTNSSSWTLENNWNNSTEVSQTYLDQTGQTREEAEALAKSESGTYNLSSSNGGADSYTGTNTGSYTLSNNNSHSNTTTIEKGQNFDLSVDAKFSNEMSVGASIPIKVVNLDVGAKYGFEIGAGIDYGNYVKNTESGTNSWSTDFDISKETSRTTVAEKNWNTSEGYSNSKSTSTNSTVANAVSKLISEQYGYGSSYAEGGSNSSSQALASTDTKSDEYSATVTYHTSKIQSTTKTIETTGSTFGDYRYVMAGTVHVFAVIGYDVAEQTYFVYTYNVMDDETYEYVDYSFDGTFNDYETSIIPFEIPHFVNDYVNTRIAKTSGLMIDPDTGVIVNYIPDSDNPDTIVIIPSYISVDNGDGTFKSVKVTGIAEGLFKNNKNIVGVKLGNYITEIPDSAFEGCSSLKYVVTPSVTKIGDNAFNGCISLEEFTLSTDVSDVGTNAFNGASKVNAVAANANVAQAVASSGAENIVLDISSIPQNKSSNMSFVVGDITSFELQGKEKEYSGLSVKSNATTTVINGVKFIDCTNIPMDLDSENVTLNRVTANAQGLVLVNSADDANIKLNQNVVLTSTLGNVMLCKNVSFASLSNSVVGKMTLTGNMLVAGTEVNGENLINFNSGAINYITDDEFENYRSSCTVTFNANGGSVGTTSKSVMFNTAIGSLPTPTYGNYTFLGWYTTKNGGKKVTSSTVVTSASGMTLYARWNNWDGTSSEPAYNSSTKTYTITTGNELAWVSDVTNGVITSGTNFPTDNSFSGYTIKLANDIYLNDISNYKNWATNAPKNRWKGIGGSEISNDAASYFSGVFDGCNFYVMGMYHNDYSGGVFNYSDGTIKNLGTDKCYILGGGAIVKANYGTVSNCRNNSELSGDGYIGGIAEYNEGTIAYCYNAGKISGKGNRKEVVAGITTSNYATVEYCYNTGDITGAGRNVYGISPGIVSYSYNTGAVTATDSSWGSASGIGGDTVKYCYNLGNIVGGADSIAGGISASPGGDITNCYNRGSVNAGMAGGICGSFSDGQTLKYCYNTGTITGDNNNYGSIVGFPSLCTIKYCYSNKTPLNGTPLEATISNVECLSSTNLKTLSNLTGFSTSYWAVDSSINGGYPYLKALKDSY